ncbi:outer membrane protein OmpA-like peptidoglycan-associated protein [Aquimarina sp. EL_43]|uniref:OmpA family protein n=1 Tax=Aquimarina TaxID=290174 RepID=UPI00046E9403|nr:MULTISPECIES: OmpA family protein [Aquimarina]MBG6132283.1 outer membrane protein OmpA-like peptidoglycan-associated protein [Aquimarina sp. EL_35]MBG6153767.1 outer membrane protein OmpA-like peptidoglycan-associated protein [Aquimarina sp. EL_32]MBG6171923.1 outer membrane protein OmpA-like peptidoglycan-associated protein [Aquimarina sp. EL_43]
MGKILRTKKLTTLSELIIVIILLGAILGAVYYFAPGLRVGEAKQLDELNINKDEVDNVTTSEKLELPSNSLSNSVKNKPLVRMAAYAWNAQSGIIVSNGGPKTTKGSLMEQNGVNLEIIRQDWLSELRNMQMKFIEEFDRGEEFPDADKSAFAIMMMGDGAPFYISTMQQALDDKFGKDKYHVQVVGAVGLSYGEDKLIGPPSWKVDPKSMKGALISAVLGDGDWVTALNYAFANGLKVNPDVTTYDPDAVNFYPSQDDDYIKSAEELIKSQKAGWTVPLKEVRNGKLTGKTINKKVDGCATWTPGDKMVFDELNGFTDIISTREFNNQMATTVIAVKEWSVKHPEIVSNILKSALTASNQMKQYDEWRVRASEAVAKTYDLETPKYWYDMFKGQKGSKNGIDYNMGGSRVFNYADVMQYYGITDGTNRYKAVYNQVSSYLNELNPFGFNESVKRIVPYDEAVNLYFIKNINDIDAGSAYKPDYTKEAEEVLASGEWNINFDTGSANISGSSANTLETIYNLLIQAEDTKLRLEGHTDDTGSAESNYDLSQRRAQSVVNFLRSKGIPQSRFQSVIGKGEDEPIETNTTSSGRAKNRRVVITLLK